MSTDRSVVLAEPVRTAIGTLGGALKDIEAVTLGATAIRAAVERSGLRSDEVETVAMGNVIQAGNKMNSARQAAIRGGLPVQTPALTVNRVCGSGAQAIVSVAQEILLGNANVGVAGGMESMDRAPFLVGGGRWGYRMGDAQLYDSALRDGLNDAFSDEASGWHTEDLVTAYQVSREAQDRWAVRSQERFAAAQSAGRFDHEITPVEVPGRKGPTVFDKDEHNRPGATLDALARLERRRGGYGADGRGLRRRARAQARGEAGVLGRRGGRAGHVRPWADPSRTPGPGAGRLGDRLGPALRDQRGIRSHRHRRGPGAGPARRHRQRGGRSGRAWPRALS